MPTKSVIPTGLPTRRPRKAPSVTMFAKPPPSPPSVTPALKRAKTGMIP
jgi:hypothetical protein